MILQGERNPRYIHKVINTTEFTAMKIVSGRYPCVFNNIAIRTYIIAI